MFRRVLPVPFVAAFAIGCNRTANVAPSAASPVVVVDPAHSVLSRPKDALRYSIEPGQGFELDGTQSTIDPPTNAGGKLNAVQIVGNGRAYMLPWDPQVKRATVDASSVEAIEGPAFPGVHAGESWVVAIGVQHANEADHKLDFYPAWVGFVDVTGKP
jgi:hypothetical protein